MGGDVAGFEDVTVGYGRYKVAFGREALADWNGGVAYLASMELDVAGGDLTLDYLRNDDNRAQSEEIIKNAKYKWAASATYETEVGGFDLFTNATYGENFDGDNVYGAVIMPSKELIEDKLEAVVRYQWARSSGADLLRPQSRNVRNVSRNDIGLNVPRGDENHTIYGGLNYFLCDHNAKIMAGVEYETVDGGAVDSDATT